MKELKICRVCTKLINDKKLIKLFQKTHDWIIQIQEITGIVLKNSKPLPQYICKICQEDLENAYKFRERCISAQEYFNSVEFVRSISFTEDLQINVKHELLPPPIEEFNNEGFCMSELQIKDELPIEQNFCFVKTERTDVPQEENDALHDIDCTSHNSCNVSNYSADINADINTDALSFDEIEKNPVDDTKLKEEKIDATPRVKRQYRKRIKDPNAESKKQQEEKLKISRRKIKTEDDSRNFICDQCGSYFNCKSNFLTHQRRHTGDKEYHCEICPEQFFLHSELKRHVRKHTGERPFPCRYCERRFIDYSTRFKHERTHTNERPFACTQCTKAFTNSYILKNHMLSHTGERSFRCDMCDKSFGRKTHLVTHYRSMQHKQNLEKQQQGTTTLPPENTNWAQLAGAALQLNLPYKDPKLNVTNEVL